MGSPSRAFSDRFNSVRKDAMVLIMLSLRVLETVSVFVAEVADDAFDRGGETVPRTVGLGDNDHESDCTLKVDASEEDLAIDVAGGCTGAVVGSEGGKLDTGAVTAVGCG
jgi:hypothetical protein